MNFHDIKCWNKYRFVYSGWHFYCVLFKCVKLRNCIFLNFMYCGFWRSLLHMIMQLKNLLKGGISLILFRSLMMRFAYLTFRFFCYLGVGIWFGAIILLLTKIPLVHRVYTWAMAMQYGCAKVISTWLHPIYLMRCTLLAMGIWCLTGSRLLRVWLRMRRSRDFHCFHHVPMASLYGPLYSSSRQRYWSMSLLPFYI